MIAVRALFRLPLVLLEIILAGVICWRWSDLGLTPALMLGAAIALFLGWMVGKGAIEDGWTWGRWLFFLYGALVCAPANHTTRSDVGQLRSCIRHKDDPTCFHRQLTRVHALSADRPGARFMRGLALILWMLAPLGFWWFIASTFPASEIAVFWEKVTWFPKLECTALFGALVLAVESTFFFKPLIPRTNAVFFTINLIAVSLGLHAIVPWLSDHWMGVHLWCAGIVAVTLLVSDLVRRKRQDRSWIWYSVAIPAIIQFGVLLVFWFFRDKAPQEEWEVGVGSVLTVLFVILALSLLARPAENSDAPPPDGPHAAQPQTTAPPPAEAQIAASGGA